MTALLTVELSESRHEMLLSGTENACRPVANHFHFEDVCKSVQPGEKEHVCVTIPVNSCHFRNLHFYSSSDK